VAHGVAELRFSGAPAPRESVRVSHQNKKKKKDRRKKAQKGSSQFWKLEKRNKRPVPEEPRAFISVLGPIYA